MASIFFDGLMTGLDTTAIIRQLMSAEAAPKVRLEQRQATAGEQLLAVPVIAPGGIESDRQLGVSEWRLHRIPADDGVGLSANRIDHRWSGVLRNGERVARRRPCARRDDGARNLLGQLRRG